ncbi:MAG: hypothetical protein D6755_10310 [Anaerolineae bacterium]|nr:MAG: hypothetical protein D6755_10310 [Anaerolineae bacterium]
MSTSTRSRLIRFVTLAAVIALSIGIYVYRERALELAGYGYLGIFLLSFLANATIILPAPGVMVVFAMGGVFPAWGIALAAGLGAALGELSGYLAGYGGQAIVDNIQRYQQIVGWMQRKRSLAYALIFVMALVPNPLFDLAGIAAGTLKIPLLPFLFWCACGKILKMLAFAYAGHWSLGG